MKHKSKLGAQSKTDDGWREVTLNGEVIGEVSKSGQWSQLFIRHSHDGTIDSWSNKSMRENANILEEEVLSHVEGQLSYYQWVLKKLKGENHLTQTAKSV